jgi:hypothetical protein
MDVVGTSGGVCAIEARRARSRREDMAVRLSILMSVVVDIETECDDWIFELRTGIAVTVAGSPLYVSSVERAKYLSIVCSP